MTRTVIPLPTENFVDQRGQVTRSWRRYLENIVTVLGGSAGASLYVGKVDWFPGDPSKIPVGWLPCDGSLVKKSTYPELYTVLGSTWGAETATEFYLPDLNDGRVLLGADGTTFLPGQYYGNLTATLVQANLPNVALPVTDPGHNHGITDPGHAHTGTVSVTDPGHTHVFTGAPHGHAVTDPGHTHGVTDPGHSHGTPESFVVDGAGTEYESTLGTEGSTVADTASATTGVTVNSATTGVTINNTTAAGTNASATTGITAATAINAASTGVSANSNTTGITVRTGGTGTPISIIPYGAAGTFIIKYQ